jgi:molybdate transport system substrate-binding protein
VALGEADAGFAYVSDVTQDMISKIDKIVIPDEYNIIAEYPLGMLMESKYPAESQRFMDLVMSDEGRAVLEKYGFDPVESEPEVREETASATEAAA